MRKKLAKALCVITLLFGTTARAAVPAGKVVELACAPTSHGVLAVLIKNTVWITRDGGLTWTIQGTYSRFSNIDSDSSMGRVDESAPDDPPYDVGQTEETHSQPEQRIKPPTLLQNRTKPGHGMASEGDGGKAHLAVSDTGAFAVFMGNRLVLGDFGGARFEPIRQGAMRGFVSGMAFDPMGRLWVAFDDVVVLLASSSEGFFERKRWSIRRAGQPTLDRDRERILIPAAEGLLAFPLDLTTPEVIRPGKVSAAAATGKRTLVARGGKIWVWEVEPDSVRELPTPPAPVTKIVPGANDALFLQTSKGAWFERDDKTWRHLNITALHVDASGKVWVGTHLGPRRRLETFSQVPILSAKDAAVIHIQAQVRLSESPGPPPRCPEILINPLPRAGVFFGYQRGAMRRFFPAFNLPRAPFLMGAQNRWEVFFGISLAWSFEPQDPSACASRRHAFASMKAKRALRVESLLQEYRQVGQERWTDVMHAIEQSIHRARTEEMLIVLTQGPLNEESFQ